MRVAIFALFVVFAVANVWVEARNTYPAVHWWDHPLSWYLHGVPYAWVQSVAYLGLVAAEAMMVHVYARAAGEAIALWIAAGGLFLVTATANMHGRLDFPGRRKVHVTGAVAAYGGVLAFEFQQLWPTPSVWLPISTLAVAIAFALWAPKAHSLDEKAVTLVMLAGLVPIIGLSL